MEFNGTFLASIVSFIVFVFLMNKVLYAPMGKIVKERQSFIEGNLECAEANHKRADELSQERDDKLSGAKNDARSKYVESVNGFKNEKTQIVAKAQDETNSELSQAYENLNNVSNETKEVEPSPAFVRLARLVNDCSLSLGEGIEKVGWIYKSAKN